MFSSISSCTPNSSVSTGFVSTKQQILDVPVNIDIYVSGNLISSRPIPLSDNELVEAKLLSPANHLDHQFYQYSLDGIDHVFAVVNKNLYQPTVKNTEEQKKWFNYNSTKILVDFYKDNLQRPLGNGKSFVDIKNTHIVLDHINFAVCFYSTSQELITRVPMTSSPIEYKKILIADSVTGNEKVEALILCGDRRLYRIRFDNLYDSSDAYTPTVIPVNFFDNLWFEADLPNGASLLDLRRKNLRSKLNPLVTALDIGPDNIWLGGYDNVWVLQKNFQFVKSISIPNETVVSLACIDNHAIAVTRTGKVFYIKLSGEITLLHTQNALGVPCSFDDYQSVAVPDPNNQQLLIFSYNSNLLSPLQTSIEIEDTAPAYVRNFNNNLWVTSHDNNQIVKVIPTTNAISRYYFDHKVTLVSVVNENILSVQYHQDQVILDLTGIKKVIPFTLQPRTGSVTHVGTEPVLIKMLGEESIIPIAGPNINCWINGSADVPVNTGDYLGISFKAENTGIFRRSVIVGENAFDYDIDIKLNKQANQFYIPNAVTVNNVKASTFQSKLTPDVGDLKNGSSIFNLGFDFSVFGNVYSTVNVSTTGVITFANTVVTEKPVAIGNLQTDALYVEFGNLYQGRPLDNRNPLNIQTKPLTNGEVPGIYYSSGTINEFNYFKARWVGIEAPVLERFENCLANITDSYFIPVTNLANVENNDYISGSGITQSTKIVNRFYHVPRTINVVSTKHYVNTSGRNFVRLKLEIPSNWSGASNTATPVPLAPSLISPPPVSISASVPASNIIVNGTAVSTSGNVGLISGGVALSGYAAYHYRRNSLYTQSTDGEMRDVIGNTLVVSGSLDSWVDQNITVSLPVIYSDASRDTILRYDITNVVRKATPVYITEQFSNTYIVDYNIWAIIRPGDLFRYQGLYYRIFGVFTTVDNRYCITTNVTLSLPVTVYINFTDIVFSSNVLPLPFNTIKNESPGLDSSREPFYYQYYIDVADKTQFITANVTVSGNFAVTDNPVTLTSNTSVMFNQDIDTTPLTYEVGLYSNGNYQFIEYYYNNTEHQTLTNVGMSSAAGLSSNIANISPGRSGLFYSNGGSGIWKFFGDGYLNTSMKLYPPIRDFVPVISKAESLTQARIEFTIDQDLTANDNILLSTSYGELVVNNGIYTGVTPISAHDVVSLVVPVNSSLRIVTPIITIGNEQFTVPMISSSIETPLNEISYYYGNQTPDTLVSTTVIVPITDTYYIPEYYKKDRADTVDTATFKLVRDGIESFLNPGEYYDLNAGDELSIIDFKTAPGLYNSRVIDIVGSFVLRFIWQTDPGPVFDNLAFDTLIDPIIRNDVYTFSTVNNDVFIDREKFLTANVTLSSANPLTGNIYVNDLSANIVINGVVYADLVNNVSTGSNIAIIRNLFNYYQTKANIFQVKFDTVTNSNVYIPIGNWDISNKIITGATLEDSSSKFGEKLFNVFSKINSMVTDSTLDPILARSPTDNTADKKQIRYDLAATNPLARPIKEMSVIPGSQFSRPVTLKYFTNNLFLKKFGTITDNSFSYNTYSTGSALVDQYSSFGRRTAPFYSQTAELRSRSIGPYFTNWGLIIAAKFKAMASGFTSFTGIGAKHQYITSGSLFQSKTVEIYANSAMVSAGNISSRYDNTISLFTGKTSASYANVNILDTRSRITSEYLQTNYVLAGSAKSWWDTAYSFIDTEQINSQYEQSATFIDTLGITSGGYISSTYMLGKIKNIDYFVVPNELYGQTEPVSAKKFNYLFSSVKSKSNLFFNLIKSRVWSAHNMSPLEFFTKISEKAETKNSLTNYEMLSDVTTPDSILSSRIDAMALSKESINKAISDLVFIKQFSELFNAVNQALIKNFTVNQVEFEKETTKVFTAVSSALDQTTPARYSELLADNISDVADPLSLLKSLMDKTLQNPISLVGNNSIWDTTDPNSILRSELEISKVIPVSETSTKNSSVIPSAVSQLKYTMSQILITVANELLDEFDQILVSPYSDLKLSLEKIAETVNTESTFVFSSEVTNAISELATTLDKVTENPNTESTAKFERITQKQMSEIVAGLRRIVDSVSTEISLLMSTDLIDILTEVFDKNDSVVSSVGSEMTEAPKFDFEIVNTEISDSNNSFVEAASADPLHKPDWLFLKNASELLHSNKDILDNTSAETLTRLIELLEKSTSSVSDDLSPIKDGTTASVTGSPDVLLESTPEQVKWINYHNLIGALGQIKWINYHNLIGVSGQFNWYNGHLLEEQTAAFKIQANVSFENKHTEFEIETGGTDLITQGGSFVIPGGIASLFQTTEAFGLRNQIVLVKDIPYLLPYRHMLLTQTVGFSPPYGPSLFQQTENPIKMNLILWSELPVMKSLSFYIEPPIELIRQVSLLLDDLPDRPRKLVLELDVPPERPVIPEMILEQDVIWTMEVLPDSGAYQTFINIWADNGRGGDSVSRLGTNPDLVRNGPMVQYTKEYKYAPGGYKISDYAENESVKYYSAGIMNIPMTDYWNYRIYFNTRHYCVPKKGILFPVNWYVRGG